MKKPRRPFDWAIVTICFNVTVVILALISFWMYGVYDITGWLFLGLGVISLWIWYKRIFR